MNRKLKNTLKYLYFLPGALFARVHLTLAGATVGKHFEVVGRLYVRNKGTLNIGDNVRIRSGMTTNPIGIGTKTYLQIFKGGGITDWRPCQDV